MGWFSRIVTVTNGGRPHGVTRDDAQSAAIKIVWPLPSASESWIGGTVEQCDRAQDQLNARRKEFETFDPEWMRTAIMDWFDYAQRNIANARRDCETQKSKLNLDRYRSESAAKSDRTQQILRSIGR